MRKNREKTDKLFRGFYLGFIKLHILHHARIEPLYGKEFRKELERHGYDVSYGTLYPIFHNLEKDGYLESESKNVEGKIRKYYTITNAGRQALRHSMVKARELINELTD